MKTAVPSTAKDPQNPTSISRSPLSSPRSGRLAPLASMMNQSPQVQAQLKLRDEIQSSERVQNQFALAAQMNQGLVTQPRLREDKEPAQREEAPAPNCTGLPDQLKAGVENLSGISLGDVKVHYNSAKPAQLNALAYAQGTDIHVAPGQEKHLPHEAWHVVQQKAGRVKPTVQMKAGTSVNDDPHLEHEADVMGARARGGISPSDETGPAGDSPGGRTHGACALVNSPHTGPIQRIVTIGGQPFGREHVWILDDLDAIKRVSGISVSLSPMGKEILRLMLEDAHIFEYDHLASLLTSIKTLTESLDAPQMQILRSPGFTANMFEELLAMNEPGRVSSYEAVRRALPAIHARGYFVERILEQGSTKPMVLRDIMSRSQKVLKLGGENPQHIRSEVLSNRLYGAVGAPVLESSLIDVGDRQGMFMDFLVGIEAPKLIPLKLSEDFRRHIAADFLFGNWDIVKLDNWVFYKGRYYRLDNGGALIFRAQGTPKTGTEWGPDVVREIDQANSKSMVASRNANENPFFGIEPGAVAVSVFHLLNHLAPGSWERAVERSMQRLERVFAVEGYLTGADRETQQLGRHILSVLHGRLNFLRSLAYQALPFEIIKVRDLDPPQVAPQAPQAPQAAVTPRLRAHPVVQEVLRMRGGFLIRRCSEGEALAFKQAAESQDSAAIRRYLFEKRTEGEAAFSVDYYHIFKNKQRENRQDDYNYSVVIPVTDELIGYLAAEANFTSQAETASAPVLKPESEHRGLDLPDIPNVLVKETALIKFWQQLREVRIFAPGKFLTIRPEEDVRAKAREEGERVGRERWEKREKERKLLEERSRKHAESGDAAEPDEGEDFGFTFFHEPMASDLSTTTTLGSSSSSSSASGPMNGSGPALPPVTTTTKPAAIKLQAFSALEVRNYQRFYDTLASTLLELNAAIDWPAIVPVLGRFAVPLMLRLMLLSAYLRQIDRDDPAQGVFLQNLYRETYAWFYLGLKNFVRRRTIGQHSPANNPLGARGLRLPALRQFFAECGQMAAHNVLSLANNVDATTTENVLTQLGPFGNNIGEGDIRNILVSQGRADIPVIGSLAQMHILVPLFRAGDDEALAQFNITPQESEGLQSVSNFLLDGTDPLMAIVNTTGHLGEQELGHHWIAVEFRWQDDEQIAIRYLDSFDADADYTDLFTNYRQFFAAIPHNGVGGAGAASEGGSRLPRVAATSESVRISVDDGDDEEELVPRSKHTRRVVFDSADRIGLVITESHLSAVNDIAEDSDVAEAERVNLRNALTGRRFDSARELNRVVRGSLSERYDRVAKEIVNYLVEMEL